MSINWLGEKQNNVLSNFSDPFFKHASFSNTFLYFHFRMNFFAFQNLLYSFYSLFIFGCSVLTNYYGVFFPDMLKTLKFLRSWAIVQINETLDLIWCFIKLKSLEILKIIKKWDLSWDFSNSKHIILGKR